MLQRMTRTAMCVAALSAVAFPAWAGPYSAGSADPTNPYDPAVAGFVDGGVNPAFVGWATSVVQYAPAPGVGSGWGDAGLALGPVTGNTGDVVSLGDLYDPDNPPATGTKPEWHGVDELFNGDLYDTNDSYGFIGIDAPGQITVGFGRAIANGPGADLAIFENGFLAFAGGLMGELAYVEVSTDGQHFSRFPSVSLTANPVGMLGAIDPTNVYNLAGKHVNNNSAGGASFNGCYGTPFDLDDLSEDAMVQDGSVDLYNIQYVRLVDIPGSGDFADDAGELIDPATGQPYPANHPIYEAWVTYNSGGFDLEAVGVLCDRLPGDANLDGVVDSDDADIVRTNWASEPASHAWTHGDFNSDGRVDLRDASILLANWQATSGGSAAPDGPAPTSIPEPTSLVAIALAGLAAMHRRRR